MERNALHYFCITFCHLGWACSITHTKKSWISLRLKEVPLPLQLTPHFSSVSKWMGKQSNLCYLFEKVTQIQIQTQIKWCYFTSYLKKIIRLCNSYYFLYCWQVSRTILKPAKQTSLPSLDRLATSWLGNSHWYCSDRFCTGFKDFFIKKQKSSLMRKSFALFLFNTSNL